MTSIIPPKTIHVQTAEEISSILDTSVAQMKNALQRVHDKLEAIGDETDIQKVFDHFGGNGLQALILYGAGTDFLTKAGETVTPELAVYTPNPETGVVTVTPLP